MQSAHLRISDSAPPPVGVAPTRLDIQRHQAPQLWTQMQAQAQRLANCERELASLRCEIEQLATPAPPSPPTWRRITKRAGRALRRRSFAFAVEPLQDLRRAGADRVEYVCTGSKPQLSLTCGRDRLPYGWVKLRLTLKQNSGCPVSLRLYLDTGTGFNEADSQALPMPQGRRGSVTHILYLPPNVQHLRLNPNAHDGPEPFYLADVRVQEITKQEALAELLVKAVAQRRMAPQRWPAGAVKLVRKLSTVGVAGALNLLQHRGGQNSRLYTDWVRQYDTLTAGDLAAMTDKIASFAKHPLICIIMPVHNPPEEFLRRAIASVQRQIYPHWQLCIADDASTHAYVGDILQAAAAEDPRIKVRVRPTQGHICAASNTALALATGSFVAFLDHDDELREHALYLIAHTLQNHADAALIYSDEDKIDSQGQRYDPHFKSGWNPELLRSQNYISHLACYRRSLVEAVGGLREGFEGSQDYDLVLRITQNVSPQQVHHIPHILYLWRAIPGSTAHTPQAKPYTFEAAHRALRQQASHCDDIAEVSLRPDGFFRTRYALPAQRPLVSIIIPTRDHVDLVRQCIDSIRQRSTYAPYEIIIVDNDSAQKATRKYFASLHHEPHIHVVPYHLAFNYAAINNMAAAQAQGSVLCLLNNDIEVITADWLQEMVSHALRPDVGAVGAKLYYPDRTIQHAGVVLGVGGIAGHAHKHLPGDDPGRFSRASLTQQYAAVTGACLVVRKQLYLSVGGLDEQLRVAYNDVDFCLRLMRLGLKNIWTPYAEFVHHESATRGADTTAEKLARVHRESSMMRKRWGALLDNDPFYNPNLTLSVEDFSLALPPRAPRPWCATAP